MRAYENEYGNIKLRPAGGLHGEMSQCSAPLVSVKDRTVGGLPMYRYFATDCMLW
jgi:hypothetical protein